MLPSEFMIFLCIYKIQPEKVQPEKLSYLLAVLQLFHPEPSSLETAAVGQIWKTKITKLTLS